MTFPEDKQFAWRGELGGSMIMLRCTEKLGEKREGGKKWGLQNPRPGPQQVCHGVGESDRMLDLR